MGNSANILDVPTHIVTGFLGAGKTSAILNLLAQKPAGERWAILVNEFGEIGIDGAMLTGQYSEQEGVFVGEVPGGCMCCSASLPMQIALNRLLKRARPHRLVIEPSGLGHPVEVLEVLSSKPYQDTLSIEKIVTLVDARNLSDERYTRHPTFNQQLAIADVIIGNKKDLYQHSDQQNLVEYAAANAPAHTPVVLAEQGNIALSMLTGKTGISLAKQSIETLLAQPGSHDQLLAGDDAHHALGHTSGEGFQSAGWAFAPGEVFDRQKLLLFFGGLNVERMKAVFITSSGVFGYNLVDGTLTEMSLDDTMESRIDIIATDIDPTWENAIRGCIAASPA